MPNYLIALHQPTTDELPPAAFLQQVSADLTVINDELRAQGAWVFAGGLMPPSDSTVLRLDNDEIVATDGPYLELKEHLGGFTVVDVADFDTAVEWAKRIARATTLPTEVRPFRW